MQLKIQQIGNSFGVTIPKEELTKRDLGLGDIIEIEFPSDPFWDDLKKFTKAQRIAAEKDDGLGEDDIKEWEGL